jgi:predicted O-linked N-acetylglucosamine transferase (SPINDLY family)
MASIAEALAVALKHHRAGQFQAAERIYRQILAVDPNQVETLHLLGNMAHQVHRYDVAVSYYRRVLELRPNLASAHSDLGVALRVQGKIMEAIACYQRALQLQPTLTMVHTNLGSAFKELGQLREAIACFRRAVQLNPKLAEVDSNLLYTLIFCPEFDAEQIYQEHCRWNQQHAAPLASFIQPHANDRSPDRRLRVGYVSPDFREHAASFFTTSLFSAHNHRDFEVFCYSDVVCPDGRTRRLQGYADVWRNVLGQTDEQVAQLVRQDRVDILVDLAMHMAHNRLLVFARKPAPVQVTWLAYPGTTGLPAIDYRLTDPFLDPPRLFDRYYAEESVRLADTFWCYNPLSEPVPITPLPALENGYVTFGCLNNFCKLNDGVLTVWARVLQAVDGSRLMILAPESPHRQRIFGLFEQAGVAPERVTFVAEQPRPQYLELYQRIDLGLDTFPYNGHTTSLDGLWMGVPTVTLVGQTVVGRAGWSQLSNLGLQELAAQTHEQYVRLAADLAGDWPRLAELRASLRGRLQASPLMDAPRFARHVEAAYRQMWRSWCAKP